MTTRKRKILTVLLLLLALAAVLIAALPLWFPWVLRPALRQVGVHYAEYERVGYSRFALVDAAFATNAWVFRARRIEAFVPTVWFWHHQFRHTNHVFLHLTDWRLQQDANTTVEREKNPTQSTSVYALLDQLETKLPGVRNWLPRARFTHGTIRAGNSEFEIPEIDWENGHLRIEAADPGLGQRIRLDGDFTTRSRWPLRARVEPLNFEAAIELRKAADAAEVSGVVLWRTNRLTLESKFLRQGWLPSDAILKVDSFRIPAADLKIKGYSDLSGSISAEWHQNQLGVEIRARAEPSVEKAPLLTANFRARGTTNALRIDQFQVAGPFLQANLSPGTEISLDGQLLSPESTLRFEADLSQQSWVLTAGKLRGELRLRRGTRNYPDASFALTGQDLSGFGMRIQEFSSSGSMLWPLLEVQHFVVRLAEDTAAHASARLNLQSHVISDGKLQLTGSGQLPLLPGEYSFDQLSAGAEFHGRLEDLTHSIHLDVTKLHRPGFEPLNVKVAGQGQQLHFDLLDAQIAAGNSSLTLSGAADLATNRIGIVLPTLTLTNGQQQIFALTEPFNFSAERIYPSGGESSPRWLLRCGQFDWRGDDRLLQVGGSAVWPNQGRVSAMARDLTTPLFQDFLTARLPEIAVNDLAFNAVWTNGPATFQLSLNSQLAGTNSLPFAAELKASGGATGLAVDRLAISSGTNVICSGQGSLPITINPARTGAIVRVETGQAIEFRAATQPNQNFWSEISKWTHLNLREPSLEFAVSGTLESPKGHIVANVASLELPVRDTALKLPRLDKLAARLEIVPGLLRLHDFQVFVEDQPIRATGEIPFTNDFSAGLKDVVDLKNATARVRIDGASLAPFAPFFPKLINPQGQLTLDLTVRPGPNFDGALSITNVATRPVIPLGAVQDISARLKFAGQRIQLENFTGFFGGEPLVVSGMVDFAQRDPETDLPHFTFKIRGDNIPLARQPELILRSDLDISISNVTNRVPVIGGSVRLRDSFYLADLKLLIPGRVAAPSRRPPYFSIETEPLADWRLAVHVEGDRFVKVRTPFFRGGISANVSLQGTLREPAAVGDVRIHDGIVQFPFANLRVDRGLVSLTVDNPYRPQLRVNASARTLGYEIKMEMSGSADEPIIQFSSTPALSSEQIVLLLTTGEMPGNQITISNQQRAGRMALFVGKNLFSRLTGGEGNSDRLTIRSGENVTENGKQTYYIEYKLTDDWSLVGEYDRFSAFNAGVKWRFYAK